MSSAIDDALEYCIKFILDRFQIHSNEHAKGIPHPPFFLGVSGIQGQWLSQWNYSNSIDDQAQVKQLWSAYKNLFLL